MSLPTNAPPHVPRRTKPTRSASAASDYVPPVPPRHASGRKISAPLRQHSEINSGATTLESPKGDFQPPPLPTTPRPRIPGFAAEPSSPEESYVYVDQGEMQSSLKRGTSEGMSLNQQMLCSILAGREDEQFTLSDVVERYSKYFPFRVRVEKGFFTDRVEIASGEMYNIHFLKRTKVVAIRDSANDEYIIPFNSAVQFGLIYGKPKQQTTFETVGDIISAETLPNIITATRRYRAHDDKASVEENEVLIVNEVHKPKIRGMGRTTLKVFSLTKKEDKSLQKECNGGFSTEPYYTRLHLPELLAYLPNLLPASANLYLDTEGNQFLPSHMLSEVVTLKRIFTETSLIATECANDESEGSDDEESVPDSVVDIPLSLDIEVVIIPPAGSGVEKLYMDTRQLFQGFNPSKTTMLKDSPFAAQSHFYTAIREGHEKDGMDLEVPTLAYGTQTEAPASYQTISDEAMVELEDYEAVRFDQPPNSLAPDPMSPLTQPLFQPPALPPPNKTMRQVRNPSPRPGNEASHPPISPLPRRRPPSSVSSAEVMPSPPMERPPMSIPGLDGTDSARESGDQSSNVQRSVASLKAQIQAMENAQQQHGIQIAGITSDIALADISRMKKELKRLSAAVKSLKEESKAMKGEIASVKQNLATVPIAGQSPAANGVTDTFSIEKCNREGLRSLDQMQLVTLLELMGMKEYQDVFTQHTIDGELLADCDEEILQHELQISSKLHRLKLMKIISGRHSATNILEGQSPYVAFDKPQ